MEQIARTPPGMNQSAVGDKTKLRQATISAVETGEPGTQLRTIFDVLSALGLELVVRPRTQAFPSQIGDIF